MTSYSKKYNLNNTRSIYSGYYKLYLHRVIDLTTAYSNDLLIQRLNLIFYSEQSTPLYIVVVIYF